MEPASCYTNGVQFGVLRSIPVTKFSPIRSKELMVHELARTRASCLETDLRLEDATDSNAKQAIGFGYGWDKGMATTQSY